VAQILKMLHLAQQDRVAQVQIGRGRVESRLHAQRPARFRGFEQPFAQFLFADQFRQASFDVRELFVNVQRGHRTIVRVRLYRNLPKKKPLRIETGLAYDKQPDSKTEASDWNSVDRFQSDPAWKSSQAPDLRVAYPVLRAEYFPSSEISFDAAAGTATLPFRMSFVSYAFP